MTTHELAKMLLEQPDMRVFVSVDTSKGDDIYDRVYGDPIGVQDNGGDVSILCEEGIG